MSKPLVIVESPTKVKTISKILGSEYIVKSSVGHIRDLPRNTKAIPANFSNKEIYWGAVKPNYENIYRLFTDNNISVSGIKVPSLFVSNGNRKSKIVNVSDILSRRQSVGFYIENNFKRTII